MIVESNIAHLDTTDSPATDLKLRDRFNLKVVPCVFDMSFYAKTVEVFWKNRQLFKD